MVTQIQLKESRAIERTSYTSDLFRRERKGEGVGEMLERKNKSKGQVEGPSRVVRCGASFSLFWACAGQPPASREA